jgi:hypothetical protein
MGYRPVCVHCQIEFGCIKNQVYVKFDQLTVEGDLFECSSCGNQIVTNFARDPMPVDCPRDPSVVEIDKLKGNAYFNMLEAAKKLFPEADQVEFCQATRKNNRIVKEYVVLSQGKSIAAARLDSDGKPIFTPMEQLV